MSAAAGALLVTLRRSAIGASRTQLETLNALGLKKKIGRTNSLDSDTLIYIYPLRRSCLHIPLPPMRLVVSVPSRLLTSLFSILLLQIIHRHGEWSSRY